MLDLDAQSKRGGIPGFPWGLRQRLAAMPAPIAQFAGVILSLAWGTVVCSIAYVATALIFL